MIDIITRKIKQIKYYLYAKRHSIFYQNGVSSTHAKNYIVIADSNGNVKSVSW